MNVLKSVHNGDGVFRVIVLVHYPQEGQPRIIGLVQDPQDAREVTEELRLSGATGELRLFYLWLEARTDGLSIQDEEGFDVLVPNYEVPYESITLEPLDTGARYLYIVDADVPWLGRLFVVLEANADGSDARLIAKNWQGDELAFPRLDYIAPAATIYCYKAKAEDEIARRNAVEIAKNWPRHEYDPYLSVRIADSGFSLEFNDALVRRLLEQLAELTG